MRFTDEIITLARKYQASVLLPKSPLAALLLPLSLLVMVVLFILSMTSFSATAESNGKKMITQTTTTSDTSAAPKPEPTTTTTVTTVEPSNDEDPATKDMKVSSAQVDPTRPASFLLKDEPPASAKQPVVFDENQPLHLTTIFYGRSTKVAIINGTLMKEGDEIADKTVIKINKQTVILKDKKAKADERIELSLAYKEIKQAHGPKIMQ